MNVDITARIQTRWKYLNQGGPVKYWLHIAHQTEMIMIVMGKKVPANWLATALMTNYINKAQWNSKNKLIADIKTRPEGLET